MGIFQQRTFQRGFGTFPLAGSEARKAIATAVEVGYRAFDTAQWYGNEVETGLAIAEAGIPLSDFLITTKVHPERMNAKSFIPSVRQSLSNLGVDCVDVLLLHWPPIDGDVVPSLKLLLEAKELGLARHIGVSNYTVAMLKTAIDVLGEPPVTNQVEFHPLLDQSRLLNGASDLGVPVSSYCSVARGRVFEFPEISEIGVKYGKLAAQVVLKWILQKGVSLNTMSTKSKNIRANFDIMNFELSNVDVARIDALNATNYRIVGKTDNAFVPEWD
ncbi:aldo/keto reductase [Thalassobium sp. R2A62]|jgi:2,5-diketo-D-gluconate reductase B|uniref:aldo/keto reductase n=1 Tax=Thalassobium sp. R2A62 TaxID=633131 RepID=UPI0001B1CE09|nr:aldo/keto reductase [Thalassobium sp. R2A62]EET48406.1 2,5-diketo-d-gluconic acid reductase b [Thalassobium sp. R2A62]MDG1340293.1 aldo/keto reductase [Paracoccaceae bacterium]MDG2453758.1 aldo/keto reductase [Paracoccaceae bacterium]